MQRHPKRRPRALTLVSLVLLPLVSLFILLLTHATLRAQPRPVLNAAETRLALQKLNVLAGVLYVGAHPDDENTAMLAYLSSGRLARAAYLSATRGDGGQNLIGTEQGELLGLLRTHELLAARRIDGAEQFFTRAIDFGFTKSPEETLRIWGKDEVLADFVWVIRRFRPDVIITRFPTNGAGGHGQHTASSVLAEEAFRAAADPARFPEQLRHVETWRPKRLLWNFFSRQTPAERKPDEPKLLSVDVGAYNALLGKSYTEIAALSRSMHKSQGFGSAERRGAALNYLEHVAGDAPDRDIFDGVDTTWQRVKGGEAVGKILEEAARVYDASAPQASLPLLMRAHEEMNKLPAGDPWVAVKRGELLEVIRACAGLWVEAVADSPHATPGGEARVTFTLVNRSDFPFRLARVELPGLAPAKVVSAELKNNRPVQVQLSARIPEGAQASQPYWLRAAHGPGTFKVSEQTLAGLAENVSVEATVEVAHDAGSPLIFEVPVLFRWTDRVRGEQYRPFEIVPPVVVRLEERSYVFPDQRPRPVRVLARANEANVTGLIELRAPFGWRVAPEHVPVVLKEKGDEFAATFQVTPSKGAETGALNAAFDTGGVLHSQSMLSVEHAHVPPQTVFRPAEARAVRVDVARRGARVGYVMGSGDEIPQSLRQLGYDVTLLSDEDLDDANLSAFDAIITGVRAYNTRTRLRQQQKRLLEYVAAGGTLVAQYNTNDALAENLGPFPFKLSGERVTVEEAPVAFALPAHALLNVPNKITASDFEGWVQERGLYFPSEWDARYETPLATSDPGEAPKRGGTLYARHGKGVYIYTSYAWFRQLPAGVPGAYKLFANMVSAGK